MAKKHKKKKHGKKKISGTAYASVGSHKKGKKGKKGKKRKMGNPAYIASAKDYAMALIAGGITKMGADMLNPKLYELTKGPIVPALAKVIGGGVLFHMGKGSPIMLGASIGLGASGLEDGARWAQIPWIPVIPITADAAGKYTYKSLTGPAKDLFVVLPEHRQVAGPERDAPVIAEETYGEMGKDAPVISADAPVISGGGTYANVIGGY